MVDRHVKGGVLHARMEWVREKHGLDGFEELMQDAKKKGYSSPLKREEFKIAKWYSYDDLMMLMKIYIEKHGKLGKSWGCPALPEKLSKGIIDAIKDGSCLFIYFDNKSYIEKSQFANIETALLQFSQERKSQ